ncbi:MAG: GIY-YIG nuclease family protein, partial [Candidatus Nanosynbacter sp. P5B_S4_bin.39.1]|nr:GIY-YIG nuclease family protein [Candidatus Nanosynbacter sp. P5B_S4_bin.39.1]
MNQVLQDKLKTLPRTPGVYFHKSASGEVIYVGKAAVLKNRVRQYFQDSRGRDNKTMALVAEIFDTDWIETESEVDALFLESEMIKRYMPRYNVLLRDDKSQMYVRIDMKSDWPTVSFTRNPADDGADYFGPFYNGFALKKA